MKCLICKKEFIIKRKIKDLLIKQIYFVCNNCYKTYPIKLDMTKVPLSNNKELIIISLFEEDNKFNADAYILEYSKIALRYINKYAILLDNLFLSEDIINYYDVISRLISQNVYVICNRLKVV